MIHALTPVRTAAPAITPVSLVEAKAHLRVDHDDEDLLIEALIAAATERLDGWVGILGRCLVEQEWQASFAGFAGAMRLPLRPVLSIVSVSYVDPEGADQVLDPETINLVTDARSAVVLLLERPATACRPDAVTITFRAGYATTPEVPAVPGGTAAIPPASTVPAPIKAAILLMLGDLYRFTETATAGNVSEVPMSTTVNNLLAPYRVVGL